MPQWEKEAVPTLPTERRHVSIYLESSRRFSRQNQNSQRARGRLPHDDARSLAKSGQPRAQFSMEIAAARKGEKSEAVAAAAEAAHSTLV